MKERLTASIVVAIFGVGILVGAPYALGLIGSQRAEASYTDDWGTTFSGLYDGTGFIGPVDCGFPNGSSYSGGLEQGFFVGEGRYVSLEGWGCEGSFEKGRLVSAHSFTSPRGDTYRGGVQDINPHGEGTYVSVDGWSYEGQWHQGLPQGEGVFTYPDGSVYRGSLVGGLAEGQGEFTGAQAWSYAGGFSGGYRQGTGVLTLPDGEPIEGTWESGLLVEGAATDEP
ncbi:MAG: hypothetical protein LBL86_12760 [Coriobacteriales bacterium]|nr:hypothetical protein [Coriobacteriales bacterium]